MGRRSPQKSVPRATSVQTGRALPPNLSVHQVRSTMSQANRLNLHVNSVHRASSVKDMVVWTPMASVTRDSIVLVVHGPSGQGMLDHQMHHRPPVLQILATKHLSVCAPHGIKPQVSLVSDFHSCCVHNLHILAKSLCFRGNLEKSLNLMIE